MSHVTARAAKQLCTPLRGADDCECFKKLRAVTLSNDQEVRAEHLRDGRLLFHLLLDGQDAWAADQFGVTIVSGMFFNPLPVSSERTNGVL